MFLILCGAGVVRASNVECKFSDSVATEMAKAQTHESTLTNCGASAMCNEGLTTLKENSMLFMRNSLHFMKHI
uniref:Bm13345 n=1 Tax=Brugia malayi TaxID=6279 RepID=A0A0J9YB51_BRUMA|nr:Bm13345 [Brugia malayi]